MKKFYNLFFAILILFGAAQAQTAEITVSLNERFFDALLDAVFTNLKPPAFPIGANENRRTSDILKTSFVKNEIAKPVVCDETIRIAREIDGVKTAVRFRDGKIYAPVAFAGSYNPPFVGCADFQGHAEANVEVIFDKEKQILIGRAKIINVVLSGTNGIGSSIVTRLVQSSIDKKINPIQILQADKLSFLIPIENAGGSLRMRAKDVRTEVVNGALNVYIAYEFVKV